MKYVTEYISSKELHKVTYDQINYVHLYKKIILLAKIVGVEGGCETEYYFNFEAISTLQQKVKFPMVAKPTTITKRVQNTFKQWLKVQAINTICDFKQYYSSKIKISECKRYY